MPPEEMPISEEPQTIGDKAVRGGAWIYAKNLSTSLINLGITVVLARTLTPADFGLAALAAVLLRFLTILSETGVAEYIISDNSVGRDRRIHAAFWMNLTVSVGVVLAGAPFLPWISRFYAETRLPLIIGLIALRYLLAQITIVPYALIKKRLDFQKLVLIDSIIEIGSSVFSLILALSGWGVYSLVLPGLLLEPVRMVWALAQAGWRPRLQPSFREWHEVFRYSSRVLIGTLATTVGAEGDTLIIGKTLGSGSLGLYSLAWNIANMVPRNIGGPVAKVALPAFAALAQEPERLKAGFRRMLRVLAAVCFPLIIGLFVIADRFILTLFGPQWHEAIIPLQILLVYALRYALGTAANSVFFALRRPDIQMKFSLAFIPVYLIAVIVGSRYGIIGVALGVTLARTGFGLLQLGASARLARCRPLEVGGYIFPAFLAAAGMGLVVAVAQGLLDRVELSQGVELLGLVLIGGAVYLGLLILIFQALLNDLLSAADSLSPRIGASARGWVASIRGLTGRPAGISR